MICVKFYKFRASDGDPLTYAWTLTVPSGRRGNLVRCHGGHAELLADVVGTYIARLIVNDGLANSLPDTVTITSENTVPVANAGPDQSVQVGDTVMLDGSDSSDGWKFLGRGSTAISLCAGHTATRHQQRSC